MGGGRGVHVWELMYTRGGFMSMYVDSILKSRDITLSTEVQLVRAMVFLVAKYGCESWTIRKAENQRIDAFEL